jgi:hypothetical protein
LCVHHCIAGAARPLFFRPNRTPHTHNTHWYAAIVADCDGTSQTSNRDEPLVVSGKPLYFRGRALLDAHLVELERLYRFQSTATEVLISGTSAGGQSTYIQSSFLKSLMPQARVVAVPDAGFWWDHTAYTNNASHPVLDSYRASIGPQLWNATLRGNLAKCLSAPPQGDPAYCYVQPYAYAYLDVPTFAVQSLVDPANLGYCYAMNCRLSGNTPGSCNAAQVAAITEFSHELAGSITTAQAPFGDRDGHFFTTCTYHEESCRFFDWFGVTVGGQTMNSSFYTWYTQGGGASGARMRDVDWPGDATCAYNEQAPHGSCR